MKRPWDLDERFDSAYPVEEKALSGGITVRLWVATRLLAAQVAKAGFPLGSYKKPVLDEALDLADELIRLSQPLIEEVKEDKAS